MTDATHTFIEWCGCAVAAMRGIGTVRQQTQGKAVLPPPSN